MGIVPVPIFFVIVIIIIITQKIDYTCEDQRMALDAWLAASTRRRNYICQWNESINNLYYQVAVTLDNIDRDRGYIEYDPTYKQLLHEEQVAYIGYVETHLFCIDSGKLYRLLDYFKDDDVMYNRIMHLIIYRTPKP